MLQVLSEMVGAEKLLAAVALAELVCCLEMAHTLLPILIVGVARNTVHPELAVALKVFAAVSAGIKLATASLVLVESLGVVVQGLAAPAMSADVQTVLVALGLILVLEAVATVQALILLFSFMSTVRGLALKSTISQTKERKKNLLKLLQGCELLRLLGAALAHEETGKLVGITLELADATRRRNAAVTLRRASTRNRPAGRDIQRRIARTVAIWRSSHRVTHRRQSTARVATRRSAVIARRSSSHGILAASRPHGRVRNSAEARCRRAPVNLSAAHHFDLRRCGRKRVVNIQRRRGTALHANAISVGKIQALHLAIVDGAFATVVCVAVWRRAVVVRAFAVSPAVERERCRGHVWRSGGCVG